MADGMQAGSSAGAALGRKAGGKANKAGRRKGARRRPRTRRLLQIGWREWIGLPELNLDAIRAKIDTGARTSALHASKVALFEREGRRWARFEVVLDHAHERGRIPAAAPVTDIRSITNSFGASEERVFILTPLRIGEHAWPIEISLADRGNMTFPALLGRTAIRNRAIVDPGRSYLCKWISEEALPPVPSLPDIVDARKSR